ncbi:MAG: AEC family transporter [Oscillospiraceae bacterium]|nr:AEC family transporter [Oscillospiraceae bacterium]
MTVLQLSLRLLLFIAAGFLGRKLRVMPDGFDKMLSRFVLAIPLPCMIVDSFRIEYSADNLLIVPKIVLLALGSLAFMFVVVFLATMWMKDAAMKKTVRFALLFTNFTFMGFAVVQELFGPDGFFNYVIFTLPIRVIFYGGASLMLGKKGEKLDGRETLRRFLCEPVIAVFIGFFLYAFRIELPAVLSSTIQSIGSMASPLGLMLCGIIIADADFRLALRSPGVLIVIVCRLLVVPALAVALFRVLNVRPDVLRSTVYYFALPVASLMPTFLLRYDPDAVEARTAGGYMVVASTLFCVLTIPLWTYVLDRLFPV